MLVAWSSEVIVKRSVCAIAVATLTAIPCLAQAPAATGVSHPDPVVIDTTPDDVVSGPATAAKPSAAIRTGSAGDVYGPYVPYQGTRLISAQSVGSSNDPDAHIVLAVPEIAGQVREGTLLHVKLTQSLSTATALQGSRFVAELTESVEKDGRVVLPVGSLLQGRITEVHSGRRITGRALLHLEASSIVLPDGSHYRLHAQLIDSDRTNHTQVDQEGSLVHKEHAKETLAIMGAATGTAAVAGGLIGGGVGAVVGAGIGAGASTIVWLKQDRQAELPTDARLVFTLTEPMLMEPIDAKAQGLSARPTSTMHQAEPVSAQ